MAKVRLVVTHSTTAGGRVPIRNSNTGGGSRTHTLVPQERILSPQRLPFRHAGSWVGSIERQEDAHKRTEPSRPGRFNGAGPIRSRSDRSGGTPIHDPARTSPPLPRRSFSCDPIYLASQRPATDPLGQFAQAIADRSVVSMVQGSTWPKQAGWLGRSGLFLWSWRRRGWDSNPRKGGTFNGFQDRPNRPLWHPSGGSDK